MFFLPGSSGSPRGQIPTSKCTSNDPEVTQNVYNRYWAGVCWKVVSAQDTGLEVGGGDCFRGASRGTGGPGEGGGDSGRISGQACSICISHNDILAKDQFLLKGKPLLDPSSVYQFRSNLVVPDLRVRRDIAAQQPKVVFLPCRDSILPPAHIPNPALSCPGDLK